MLYKGLIATERSKILYGVEDRLEITPAKAKRLRELQDLEDRLERLPEVTLDTITVEKEMAEFQIRELAREKRELLAEGRRSAAKVGDELETEVAPQNPYWFGKVVKELEKLRVRYIDICWIWRAYGGNGPAPLKHAALDEEEQLSLARVARQFHEQRIGEILSVSPGIETDKDLARWTQSLARVNRRIWKLQGALPRPKFKYTVAEVTGRIEYLLTHREASTEEVEWFVEEEARRDSRPTDGLYRSVNTALSDRNRFRRGPDGWQLAPESDREAA